MFSAFKFDLVVVQSLSRVWLLATPKTAAHQASLSITISVSLLKLMSIESVMPSNISSSVAPFSSCPQFLPAKFDLHTPFQAHSSSVSNTDHRASKTTSFNSDNTKFNLNYKVCVLATVWIYSIFPLYKVLFMNILKTHICKCSIQFKKLQMCGNSICQFKFILFYQILTLGDISTFFLIFHFPFL